MGKQAELLHWLMERDALTQVELGQRLSISASLVSRLVRGERRLTLPLLRQIAATFALPQTEVFARAGILEQPGPDEVFCQAPIASGDDDVQRLHAQLAALRDVRAALAWALDGKVPTNTIEKLVRLVELELEYNNAIKEG